MTEFTLPPPPPPLNPPPYKIPVWQKKMADDMEKKYPTPKQYRRKKKVTL